MNPVSMSKCEIYTTLIIPISVCHSLELHSALIVFIENVIFEQAKVVIVYNV